MSTVLIVRVPKSEAKELNQQIIDHDGQSDLKLAAYVIALECHGLELDDEHSKLFYSDQVKVDDFGGDCLTVKWSDDI